jgi:hypothetical protein
MLEKDLRPASASLMHPRKPGVLLLAHDLNMLISSLIHFVQRLFGH